MLGIIALLIVATVSVVVTKVAAAALESTGMSYELAKFQARSAYTGVGFTTSEAEGLVANTARRRIIEWLMLLGNVGTITIIASLILGFSGGGVRGILSRFGVLLVGLAFVWWFTRTELFDRWVKAGFASLVDRIADMHIRDYEQLLDIQGDYGIRELDVEAEGWLVDRTLSDLDLLHEGVMILAVRRPDGTYIGAPVPESVLEQGDIAIAYGRVDALEELQERRRDSSGEREHREAVQRQQDRQSGGADQGRSSAA